MEVEPEAAVTTLPSGPVEVELFFFLLWSALQILLPLVNGRMQIFLSSRWTSWLCAYISDSVAKLWSNSNVGSSTAAVSNIAATVAFRASQRSPIWTHIIGSITATTYAVPFTSGSEIWSNTRRQIIKRRRTAAPPPPDRTAKLSPPPGPGAERSGTEICLCELRTTSESESYKIFL